MVFFFQAEAGIRDLTVTGVQTCALPISLVFPAGLPMEIAFYDMPQAAELIERRGIGKLLVDWASRADRGQELAQQVAARQATPADAARGHLLLTQFHVSRHERNEARPHLEAITVLLESTKLPALAD